MDNNTFYIISSPIGNLKDISLNSIEVLEKLEYLFCEDTRNTAKLLSLLNIKNRPKLISFHNHSENKKTDEIFEIIKNNQSGLISDAGYPLISDPGYILIKKLISKNIPIEVTAGPSALIHGLILSSAPTIDFFFVGFLPYKANEQSNRLSELKSFQTTLIIYESVHRILNTLENIKNIFGDIEISVCREISKKNQTIYVDKISEILKLITLKGEIVIVINNRTKVEIDDNILLIEIENLVKSNIQLKIACKMVAYKHSVKSNALYSLYNKIHII